MPFIYIDVMPSIQVLPPTLCTCDYYDNYCGDALVCAMSTAEYYI